MLRRTGVVNIRVSDEERAVFRAVAQRLDRDESTTIRNVMKQVAEQLGVTPAPQASQTADASGKRAA